MAHFFVVVVITGCAENPKDTWVKTNDVKVATTLCEPNGGLEQVGTTHFRATPPIFRHLH